MMIPDSLTKFRDWYIFGGTESDLYPLGMQPMFPVLSTLCVATVLGVCVILSDRQMTRRCQFDSTFFSSFFFSWKGQLSVFLVGLGRGGLDS